MFKDRIVRALLAGGTLLAAVVIAKVVSSWLPPGTPFRVWTGRLADYVLLAAALFIVQAAYLRGRLDEAADRERGDSSPGGRR